MAGTCRGEVWSKPEGEPGHAGGWKPVEELFVRTGRVWHLHVGGELIRTTGEHPFYVVGKGWTDACFLEVGDLLCSRDGSTVAVEECYDTGEYERVYNCRVAEWHTYFVGDEGWCFDVWAHNALCSLPGADPASAVQGREYALLAKQLLYGLVKRRHQGGTTIVVTEVMVAGQRRYVIGVFGSREAYRDVARGAPEMLGGRFGDVHHGVGVQGHGERLLHSRYAGTEGFTGVIGHSNAGGTCPHCQPYFQNANFANVWWDNDFVR